MRTLLMGLALQAVAASPPPFPPLLATHLMIWQSSSEPWWTAGNSSGYRVLSPGGERRSIDWLNASLAPFYLDQVAGAGVGAVIVDLTNEFGKFLPRVPALVSLCAARGLRLAVQVAGSAADVEAHAAAVWQTLLANGTGGNNTYLTLEQEGGGGGGFAKKPVVPKPVLVVYVTRPVWDAVRAAPAGSYTARFGLRWSSGEDSNPGKWGWQIEPFVGPEPSREAVFATPSTGHQQGEPSRWRKSLALLDFGMLVARRSAAQVVVLGSYDDVSERNAWLVADTSGAPPERQMRGADGALSEGAFFQRVRAWARGGTPVPVGGGALRDGAYRIRVVGAVAAGAAAGAAAAAAAAAASGGSGGGAQQQLLMMQGNDGAIGAPLVRAGSAGAGRRDVLHRFGGCTECGAGRDVCEPGCEPHCCTPVANLSAAYYVGATVEQQGSCGNQALTPASSAPLVCDGGGGGSGIYSVQNGTATLFWLYHQGGGAYRVLPLNSGLALARPDAAAAAAASGGAQLVSQQLQSPESSQHWCLQSAAAPGANDAAFHVVACAGGDTWQLGSDGAVKLVALGAGSTFQFEAVATL